MNDIHEGIVSIYVECTDPDDKEYNSGIPVDEDILRKYDLKPGDGVQYKISKNRDTKIIGKITITKTITPV